MGRTPKEINWEVVEKMIEASCSAREISAFLRIDINTFYDRFKLEYARNFADYSDDIYCGGIGNQKLVTHMRALSKNGSIQLLLKYNEERLGWGKSKEEVPKNQVDIDKDHIIIIQANEISELKANANQSKTE